MDTLKFEATDRSNSLQKYDFFLKNMGVERPLEELVQEFLQQKRCVKVFDLGCGDGGALRELKELFGNRVFVCGIDALEAVGLDFFAFGDAAELQFPKDCDIILSFRALHEIAGLQKVFQKICGALCSGGMDFLSVRCEQEMGGKVFFHGNLQKTDLVFLDGLEKNKEFGGARALVIKIMQKTRTGKKIVAGTNVFLAKP